MSVMKDFFNWMTSRCIVICLLEMWLRQLISQCFVSLHLLLYLQGKYCHCEEMARGSRSRFSTHDWLLHVAHCSLFDWAGPTVRAVQCEMDRRGVTTRWLWGIFGAKEGCAKYFDNNWRTWGEHNILELALPCTGIGSKIMFLFHAVYSWVSTALYRSMFALLHTYLSHFYVYLDNQGYGFRTLLEKKCADVLQPDVSEWELRTICWVDLVSFYLCSYYTHFFFR